MLDFKAQLFIAVLLLQVGSAFGQRGISDAVNRLNVHLSSDDLLNHSRASYVISDQDGGILYTTVLDSEFNLGLSYFRVNPQGKYYRLGVNRLVISGARQVQTIRNTNTSTQIINEEERFTRVSTQFEIGKYFNHGWMRVGAGVFLSPDYVRIESAPDVPEFFPVSFNDISLYMGLNPFLEVELTDNIFLTGRLPISLGKLNYVVAKHDNPFVVERERETTKFDGAIDLNLGLQVGLALGF